MALLGTATMVAICDVDDAWASELDDWHSQEHIPERVGIPGFIRGRRYTAVGPGPRCFFFYETESLSVLTSDAYLERLNNPTPWTQRVMPHFKDTERTLCSISLSIGRGLGGHMAYVGISPAGGQASALRDAIRRRLEEVVSMPGVAAAHLLEGDPSASRIETREKEVRGKADDVADWLLMVEGYRPVGEIFTDSVAGDGLGASALGPQVLRGWGAANVSGVVQYTLSAVLAEDELT